MRNRILFFLLLISALSCQEEKTISDELVGDWLYERETFNSFSSFGDPDTEGFISFKVDETGRWSSSSSLEDINFEWDLQVNESKIALTKYFTFAPTIFPNTIIYDLIRQDEDNFTFNYHVKFETVADSLDGFEQFENIILTRMK